MSRSRTYLGIRAENLQRQVRVEAGSIALGFIQRESRNWGQSTFQELAKYYPTVARQCLYLGVCAFMGNPEKLERGATKRNAVQGEHKNRIQKKNPRRTSLGGSSTAVS